MIEIPLANGKGFARVDDADAALVATYRWHILQRPGRPSYARTTVGTRPNRRQLYMHVLIMGCRADHRDGDGLNNTRINLREATDSQNQCNRGPTRANTSGYKGVTLDRRDGRWKARIKYQGKALGRYSTPEAAARAYDTAAWNLHGEFTRANFP